MKIAALLLFCLSPLVAFAQQASWACYPGIDHLSNTRYYALVEPDLLGTGTTMVVTYDDPPSRQGPVVALSAPDGAAMNVDADTSAVQQTGSEALGIYMDPPDEHLQTIEMRFSGQRRVARQEWIRSTDGQRLLAPHGARFVRSLQKNGGFTVQYYAGGQVLQARFTAPPDSCSPGALHEN